MQLELLHRTAPVHIQLLGAVRVWRGRELAGGPPQRRAVLALLALAAGHPVPREELTAALWPESPPPRATNIIQTHVKHLRQELEPARPSRTPSAVLPAVGAGYALRVDPSAVDALRFRALVAQARAARRSGAEDRVWHAASEAVRLWRTPVPDLPVLRGHPGILALVAEWHIVVSWYADVAIDRGRADEVLPMLEEQASRYPLDERIQARLLRAYQAVGRRGAAFATYERVRQHLAGELGVDPSAELAAAHRNLLHEELPSASPTVAPPAGGAAWPVRPVILAAGSGPRRRAAGRCAESGRLELLRMWDVLARALPRAPAVLLDVGGAAGRFASRLAESGYTVHTVDAVPGPGAADRLPLANSSVDGVLLLDPSCHLAERSARLHVWREAARLVRPGGTVVAAVANRFAAAFDRLLRGGWSEEGAGDECGSGACACRDPSRLAVEYSHRPDELSAETADAGLRLDRVVAVDAPPWAFSGLGRILSDGRRTTMLLDTLRELEGEPGLLGVSGRLLVLAHPDGRAAAAS